MITLESSWIQKRKRCMYYRIIHSVKTHFEKNFLFDCKKQILNILPFLFVLHFRFLRFVFVFSLVQRNRQVDHHPLLKDPEQDLEVHGTRGHHVLGQGHHTRGLHAQDLGQGHPDPGN